MLNCQFWMSAIVGSREVVLGMTLSLSYFINRYSSFRKVLWLLLEIVTMRIRRSDQIL